MDKLFNLDNPVMQALGRVADVMIVNLLTLISFVPLILVIVGIGSLGQAPGLLVMAALFVAALPVGPALTAMYYISLKMVRNEDSYIVRSYFKSYRDNFGQSVAIWAIFLVFFVFAFYDIYLLLHDRNSLFPAWMNYLILVVLFLLWCIFLWVFPVESRFVNTVGGTIRNAMVMTVAAFPRTLGMVGLSLIPLLLLYFAGDKLMPLLIMFGLAGPAYGQAKLFSPFFQRFEPKEEKTDPDAMPEALRDEPQPEEPPVGGASVLSMEDIEAQRAAIDQELEKEQEKNTK
ncbi:MAG: YesL family protein [Lachnospiraceae bacterium]|nr:YesL family protein [Lachnospiraceae bacterium]